MLRPASILPWARPGWSSRRGFGVLRFREDWVCLPAGGTGLCFWSCAVSITDECAPPNIFSFILPGLIPTCYFFASPERIQRTRVCFAQGRWVAVMCAYLRFTTFPSHYRCEMEPPSTRRELNHLFICVRCQQEIDCIAWRRLRAVCYCSRSQHSPLQHTARGEGGNISFDDYCLWVPVKAMLFFPPFLGSY